MESIDYLAALKNYLDITYDDPDTDAKLTGICRRAEEYLRKAAGYRISFSAEMDDQAALQLLFDCVRYIRSNALEEFADNFAGELWALRALYHVERMREDELYA